MKSLGVALLLVLLGSCGSLPPVNWPKLVHCAPGVSDLAGVVTRILIADGPRDDTSISDRGTRELSDLARRRGGETVACVVERLITDWKSPGASLEPTRLAAAARGRDFLADVGTEARMVGSAQPSGP